LLQKDSIVQECDATMLNTIATAGIKKNTLLRNEAA